MLDKRLAVTIVSMVVVSAMTAVVALLPRQEPGEPLLIVVSDVPLDPMAASAETSEEESDWLYLLREYDGRIAVYSQNSEKPVMILDKLIKHLPEYDRIQMQEGVAVYSEEELAARIEDYTS